VESPQQAVAPKLRGYSLRGLGTESPTLLLWDWSVVGEFSETRACPND